MSWKTVPNFFPEPDDLDSETWYHLCEGYCIDNYETKPSGKYYKKVRVTGGAQSCTLNLINFLGFWNWHEKWKPKRTILGRFFGWWEKREPSNSAP